MTTYKFNDLQLLFNSNNIDIYDAINKDNFIRFVEIYHRYTGEDISIFLCIKLNIEKVKYTYQYAENPYYYEYKIDTPIKNNEWTIKRMRINL